MDDAGCRFGWQDAQSKQNASESFGELLYLIVTGRIAQYLACDVYETDASTICT